MQALEIDVGSNPTEFLFLFQDRYFILFLKKMFLFIVIFVVQQKTLL